MPEEKLAVLAGINHYRDAEINDLSGCIKDVEEVKKCLERNEDAYKSPNFHCRPITSEKKTIDRDFLLLKLNKLFNAEVDAVLFYFSGHGEWDGEELHLVTSDANKDSNEYGIAFSEVMKLAKHSPADHVFLILDCCHSGGASEIKAFKTEFAKSAITLRQDMTIIASSRKRQPSSESLGMGKFTRSLCQALNGDFEDPLGNVTVGGLYRMVHRQFSSWEQSPVLMTNQSSTIVLRKTEPLINPEDLRTKLLSYFNSSTAKHSLDPEYDPECFKDLPSKERNRYKKNDSKKKAMSFFRELNSFGMLRPTKEKYLYYAAKNSDSVQLTPKGQTYYQMAKANKF